MGLFGGPTWTPAPWQEPIEVATADTVVQLDRCSSCDPATALTAIVGAHDGRPLPGGLTWCWGAAPDPRSRTDKWVAGLLLFGPSKDRTILVACASNQFLRRPPTSWIELWGRPADRAFDPSALAKVRAMAGHGAAAGVEAIRRAAERASAGNIVQSPIIRRKA